MHLNAEDEGTDRRRGHCRQGATGPDLPRSATAGVRDGLTDALGHRAARPGRRARLRRAARPLVRRVVRGDRSAAAQRRRRAASELREALDAGAERTRRFANMQRARLVDFEEEVIPGVVCGQRYIPSRPLAPTSLPAGSPSSPARS